MAELPEFELRNAGVGSDPLRFSDVVDLSDFAILLFLRDYHCPKCRAQVNRVAEKAERVKRRGAAVVPVLPNSYEKAATWQEKYDLPFRLLADPAGELGEEYDQPRSVCSADSTTSSAGCRRLCCSIHVPNHASWRPTRGQRPATGRNWNSCSMSSTRSVSRSSSTANSSSADSRCTEHAERPSPADSVTAPGCVPPRAVGLPPVSRSAR